MRDRAHAARAPWILAAALAASSCGARPSRPTARAASPGACELRLPAAGEDAFEPAPPLDAPSSELVFQIAFHVSSLTSRLEAEVPMQVAAGRDVDAGAAGRLTYAIHRSPFAVAVRDGSLLVSTSLRSHAELCKPVVLLGCVSYGSCSPAGLAQASIPLTLGPHYALGPSRVSIAVTRPCVLTSLGVDVTPQIQRGANQQAGRIQARLDAMLPSFRSGATTLWNALGVDVPLGLSSRLRVVPEEVVEGTPALREGVVTIPLGVRARILIESKPTEKHAPRPLPPPRRDPSAVPHIALRVPVSIDHDAAGASISRSVSGEPIEAGEEHLRITSVRTRGVREGLLVTASVTGRVCGEIEVLAKPEPDSASSAVRLAGAAVPKGAAERMAHAAPGLRPQAVAERIGARASIPLGLDPEAIQKGFERALALIRSGEGPPVTVRGATAALRSAAATEQGVVALIEARMEAEVVMK